MDFALLSIWLRSNSVFERQECAFCITNQTVKVYTINRVKSVYKALKTSILA